MQAVEVAVRIPILPFAIQGALRLPAQPRGIVLVARGSAFSRPGHHDRLIADQLNQAQIGVALLDLVTPIEGQIDEGTKLTWSDIDLFAGRLVIATDRLHEQSDLRELPFGYLAEGAGAAVAVAAASERSSVVRAIVALDGRLDLVAPALPTLATPTMLIVRVDDRDSLHINLHAMETLGTPDKALRLLRDDALGEAVRLTRDWFARHLSASRPAALADP